MGGSLKTITNGIRYQGRVFWLQACRMFDDVNKVERVAHDSRKVRHFDDVVVHYADGKVDEWVNPLHADYIQVKFHVDDSGCLTYGNLMDPGFMSAKTSFLQRAAAMQPRHAPEGTGARLYLYTNWGVDWRDPLHSLVDYDSGSIRIEQLMKAGAGTEIGQVRRAWREHLKLTSDGHLALILQPLRFRRGWSLSDLGEWLNDKLRLAGMRPADHPDLLHEYDSLAVSLLHRELSAADIQQICQTAGLWVGRHVQERQAYRIGIRSRFRPTEDMDDETNEMLSLLDMFDGAAIKSPELWPVAYDRVAEFLPRAARRGGRCHLHLHAHGSIAFAAGYVADTKSRLQVVPIQATVRDSREIWRPEPADGNPPGPNWQLPPRECPANPEGRDVAVVLNVSAPILKDVQKHVALHLRQVRRILSYELPDGPGSACVQDGSHAKYLADQIAFDLKARRTDEELQGRLHLFAAAPNGLLFFLGQQGRELGFCTWYEYDYDARGYEPSLSFGPTPRSAP